MDRGGEPEPYPPAEFQGYYFTDGPQPLAQRAPQGMQTFTVERKHDVSGVSGVGVVSEGVRFSTGVVVLHWLTPPPWGSVNIFASWEQFLAIHVDAHPENATTIRLGDGETLRFPPETA